MVETKTWQFLWLPSAEKIVCYEWRFLNFWLAFSIRFWRHVRVDRNGDVMFVTSEFSAFAFVIGRVTFISLVSFHCSRFLLANASVSFLREEISVSVIYKAILPVSHHEWGFI